jgi:hypothetical protein
MKDLFADGRRPAGRFGTAGLRLSASENYSHCELVGYESQRLAAGAQESRTMHLESGSDFLFPARLRPRVTRGPLSATRVQCAY